MTTLLEKIGQPGARHERLVDKVAREPASIGLILDGLFSETARMKYGCAKVLRLLAEQQPQLLSAYFNNFVALLDHENKIMQWEGLIVLSHLAKEIQQNRFEAIFEKYFASIPGPVMITAANAIAGGARLALAFPDWADRIAAEILRVSRARYQTAECRNVAIGHAIKAFDEFFDLLKNKKPVMEFVRRQRKNSRNAVRKKAGQFLKKHQE